LLVELDVAGHVSLDHHFLGHDLPGDVAAVTNGEHMVANVYASDDASPNEEVLCRGDIALHEQRPADAQGRILNGVGCGGRLYVGRRLARLTVATVAPTTVPIIRSFGGAG
jgi:hypothetical protein